MTLTIQFGFCSWVLVTSLGLGGDQTTSGLPLRFVMMDSAHWVCAFSTSATELKTKSYPQNSTRREVTEVRFV